jgi:hypothetical protein
MHSCSGQVISGGDDGIMDPKKYLDNPILQQKMKPRHLVSPVSAFCQAAGSRPQPATAGPGSAVAHAHAHRSLSLVSISIFGPNLYILFLFLPFFFSLLISDPGASMMDMDDAHATV